MERKKNYTQSDFSMQCSQLSGRVGHQRGCDIPHSLFTLRGTWGNEPAEFREGQWRKHRVPTGGDLRRQIPVAEAQVSGMDNGHPKHSLYGTVQWTMVWIVPLGPPKIPGSKRHLKTSKTSSHTRSFPLQTECVKNKIILYKPVSISRINPDYQTYFLILFFEIIQCQILGCRNYFSTTANYNSSTCFMWNVITEPMTFCIWWFSGFKQGWECQYMVLISKEFGQLLIAGRWSTAGVG